MSTPGGHIGHRPSQGLGPVRPVLVAKPLRRESDGWLDRWMATVADLDRLRQSHPMLDAVIDEVDVRRIRIGDHWLADFASCNYLGLDWDREVIEAVPAYLDQWGTHPSWSRLLGSPILYEAARGAYDHASGLRGHLAASNHHPYPHVGAPLVGRKRHRSSWTTGRTKPSLMAALLPRATGRLSSDINTTMSSTSRSCYEASVLTPRVIATDGVNSMTGNAPDVRRIGPTGSRIRRPPIHR